MEKKPVATNSTTRLLLEEFRSFRDNEFREFRDSVYEVHKNLSERIVKVEGFYLSREAFDQIHAALVKRIEALEADIAKDKLVPFLAALRWLGYVVAAMAGAITSWMLSRGHF